ncbi:54S ribosomal protein L4 mitochondrial [Pestalotiopsis sp. 9143b]|nr:54S ribosomal protein L4 mitochondrial [Pestalotiopsis sp. 9143b]
MASTTSLRPVFGRILQQSSQRAPSQCLALASRSSAAPFSTSAPLEMRKPRRDNSRLRGLSAIYRSGTKARMAVDGFELPEPAKYNPADEVKTDPEHGLYEFFYDKEKALLDPDAEAQHGRSWTVEELRHKSWDDLHKLWWVCVKERNRVATASRERKRLKFKTGEEESKARMRVVSKTMKSIKHALTERYYTWEDARELAEQDPEVDLSNTSSPYTPSNFFEEDVAAGAPAVEAEGVVGQEKQASAQATIDPSALPTKEAADSQPVSRT